MTLKDLLKSIIAKITKRNVLIGIGVIIAVVIVLAVYVVRTYLTVYLPDYPPVQKSVWLEQNWKADERDWYHHANQGTKTFPIPYEWFVALEQPRFTLWSAGLFNTPEFLDQFGFIPGTAKANPQVMPVGFARGVKMIDPATGDVWKNPLTKEILTSVGLTCAACHTGRFTYKGTAVFVDGAPALTDLGKFQTSLGLAIAFTQYMPFRFDRFAERVLGPDATKKAKAELLEQLKTLLVQAQAAAKPEAAAGKDSITEGFGRLDALNRIGNQVFGTDLNEPANFTAISAPVHFPRIWDASWFLWVQYNGSIMQPMVRNAGEALGVRALVNLANPNRNLYQSDVQIPTVDKMEQLLAGKQPNAKDGFNGLTSPKWPEEILGKIDRGLAAKGATLYKEICQGCHLPPIASEEFWTNKRWLPPNKFGERYLDLELIDLKHVGTDPAQAADMATRMVVVPPDLGVKSKSFGFALGEVVEKTVNYWYDNQDPPTPPAERERMNGYRPNGIQAPLAYKVRPLNGVWATPPYLHNGSVPNIYLLLSPVEERPKKFYLGHREYDPVNLGHPYDELPGGFELDTSIRGNYNTGHEFSDTKKDGVIGRALKPDERKALIEFLKTQ